MKLREIAERLQCELKGDGEVEIRGVAAIETANAFLDKFGGDSAIEIERNYRAYLEYLSGF